MFLGSLAYQIFYRVDVLQDEAHVSRRSAYFAGAALATLIGAGLTWRVFGLVVSYGSIPPVIADGIIQATLLLALILILMSDNPVTDGQLAVVLGAAMMIAAMLYPLPEVAVIVWFITGIGVNRIPLGPQLKQVLNDPVERLMIGVAATTVNIRGFVSALYIIAGLILSVAVFLDSPGTIEQNIRTLVVSFTTGSGSGDFAVSTVEEVAFLSLTAFAPAVYGVWYWLRVTERLPFALGLAADPTEDDSGSGRFGVREWGPDDSGGDHTEVEGVAYRPIPPGFGIPIVLLFAPLLVYVDSTSEISSGTIPRGYLIAAGSAAILAIGTIGITIIRARTMSEYDSDAPTVAAWALALQLAFVALLGPTEVTSVINNFLTGQRLGVDLTAVGSALAGAIILGALVVLPSKIPKIADANPVLGMSLLAVVFGVVVAVIGAGNTLVGGIAGIAVIAGIAGVVIGSIVEISDF